MLGTLVDFKIYDEKANFAEKAHDESHPDHRHSRPVSRPRSGRLVCSSRSFRRSSPTHSGPATRQLSTKRRTCRCGRSKRSWPMIIATSIPSPASPRPDMSGTASRSSTRRCRAGGCHLLPHHRLGVRLLDRLSGLAADLGQYHGPVRLLDARRRAVELANLEKIRGAKMVALGAASLADIEKDPALLALRARQGQDRVRRQLRAMPRLRRRRRQGLSEPERRRLAVGRHARPDHADHPVRRAFRPRQGA